MKKIKLITKNHAFKISANLIADFQVKGVQPSDYFKAISKIPDFNTICTENGKIYKKMIVLCIEGKEKNSKKKSMIDLDSIVVNGKTHDIKILDSGFTALSILLSEKAFTKPVNTKYYLLELEKFKASVSFATNIYDWANAPLIKKFNASKEKFLVEVQEDYLSFSDVGDGKTNLVISEIYSEDLIFNIDNSYINALKKSMKFHGRGKAFLFINKKLRNDGFAGIIWENEM